MKTTKQEISWDYSTQQTLDEKEMVWTILGVHVLTSSSHPCFVCVRLQNQPSLEDVWIYADGELKIT